MTRNRSLLEMLLELQQLDRVPRLGYSLRGVTDPESVSEHSWHVALLVWCLAPHIDGLDLARALGIALVHDLAEARTGDLPLHAASYLAAGAKDESERRATEEITEPLGQRATQLLTEYQSGVTLEARTVKTCDKLQLLVKVTAYEAAGFAGLAEFWAAASEIDTLGVPAIEKLLADLRRRSSAGS